MQPLPDGFLDPNELIEHSQPRMRGGWFKYAMGIFLLIVLGSAYLSSVSPQMQAVVRMVMTLTLSFDCTVANALPA